MTIEDSIRAAVAAEVAPLRAEVERATAEIAALRRAVPPALVTLDEAARRLRISYATARRRVRDGTLPSRRVGRALRVDLSALHPPTDDEVARRVLALPSRG